MFGSGAVSASGMKYWPDGYVRQYFWGYADLAGRKIPARMGCNDAWKQPGL